MNLVTSLRGRAARSGLLVCAVALAAVACSAGASTAAPARTATAPTCRTSGLVIWLDTNGDGTAGSTYYSLKLTNLSAHACTLAGYPGISAVDLGGHQLGSAASRTTATAHLITLGAGATAAAELRIAVAGNFPNATCRRTTAAGLRVYPPNTRASKIVPYPFSACSQVGPVYLSVKPVT